MAQFMLLNPRRKKGGNMSHRTISGPILIVTAFITLGALSSCSDLPTKSTHDRAKHSSSMISKSSWMSALPHAMSDEFCDSDSEILQCYSMSQDDCHQSVEQITTNCENHYSDEIPSHMAKVDASSWGGTIGNCTKTGILQLIQSQNLTPASDECRQNVENM
jgi:hypothetical protein